MRTILVQTHMHRRMYLVPLPLCTYETEVHTTAHILPRYPAYISENMVRGNIITTEAIWEERKKYRGQLASFSRLAYPFNHANEKNKIC